MNLKSYSPRETKKLAAGLADKINKPHKAALVLALSGDLGAGKTTFVQGLAENLGAKTRALSPTFVLMRRHKVKSEHHPHLYHIDAYRLNSEKDAAVLKLKNIFRNNQNIVLIEWAERIKKIIPKGAIWIKFSHGENGNERNIEIIRRPRTNNI